ncbi:hypothetical protein [Streptomyces halobius]|uniref:Uncharacterized protein n=1 Tax=Streptomyces halobius TaxID=2879846 RepID=A0ABY4M053_9ACTN|nr:hypothetical protein [Streptomyces halobius]UQA91073.1 hypothetical protein K9S39_03520 [Streptomyces halobius]
MNAADIGVLIGAGGLIALLACYFLGPKKARLADLRGGVQEIGPAEFAVRGKSF